MTIQETEIKHDDKEGQRRYDRNRVIGLVIFAPIGIVVGLFMSLGTGFIVLAGQHWLGWV